MLVQVKLFAVNQPDGDQLGMNQTRSDQTSFPVPQVPLVANLEQKKERIHTINTNDLSHCLKSLA